MKTFLVDGIKLKPCPFCGSPAEFTSESKDFVRCSKGLHCPTEALSFLVAEWNNRPLEDHYRKALEEVAQIFSNERFLSTDVKINLIKDITKKALEYKPID